MCIKLHMQLHFPHNYLVMLQTVNHRTHLLIFFKDLLCLQRFSLMTYFSSFLLFNKPKKFVTAFLCFMFYKILGQQSFSFPFYSSEGSPFPSNILLNWTVKFIKCFEKWLRIISYQLTVGSCFIYIMYIAFIMLLI